MLFILSSNFRDFQLTQMIAKQIFNRGLVFAYQFTVKAKESVKADSLLKSYYSSRLVILPNQYQQYLRQLSTCFFKEEDHRWKSLTKNIELHSNSFDANSLVSMLKSLVGLRSRSSLVETLIQKLASQVSTLTLQQSVVFLWCLGKISSRSKPDLLISLFNKIKQVLLPQTQPLPPISLRKQFKDVETEVKLDNIFVGATTISMLITSMANLGIVDKPLVKRIIHDAIRPNLKEFYAQTLCTFLIAFDKLNLTNKRDTFAVYKEIRNKNEELQQVQVETLFNLMRSISSLSKRNISQQEERRLQKHKDQEQKRKLQEADMKKFFLWIWETILLREPKVSCPEAALMLMNSSKMGVFEEELWRKSCLLLINDIKEAKIIDLVMAVNALASLSKDKRALLQKEQQQITTRLWNLSSSINGKSLAILAGLFKRKRLQAPPKIAKIFDQYLIQEEKKQREMARSRSQYPKATRNQQN